MDSGRWSLEDRIRDDWVGTFGGRPCDKNPPRNMVFTKFQGRLEWNENAVTGHFPNKALDNRVLLSKNLLGVVVAHCGVEARVNGCYVQWNRGRKSEWPVPRLAGTMSR